MYFHVFVSLQQLQHCSIIHSERLGSAIAKGRYSWGLSHSYGAIARNSIPIPNPRGLAIAAPTIAGLRFWTISKEYCPEGGACHPNRGLKGWIICLVTVHWEHGGASTQQSGGDCRCNAHSSGMLCYVISFLLSLNVDEIAITSVLLHSPLWSIRNRLLKNLQQSQRFYL